MSFFPMAEWPIPMSGISKKISFLHILAFGLLFTFYFSFAEKPKWSHNNNNNNLTMAVESSRNKRSIYNEMPRIVTKDGHLLFMTGVNHNITFHSASGGFVNVDGNNLNEFFSKVPKDLKGKLSSMRNNLKNLSNSVVPIVFKVDKKLNSLQSKIGNLSNQFHHNLSLKVSQLTKDNLQLKNRIQQLEQQTSDSSGHDETIRNILRRLTTIEGLHRNSLSTTTTAVNDIKQRLTTLEARPSPLTSSARRRLYSRLRALNRKVQTLTRALESNDCQSNPCQNGGSCYDRYNGFHCNCPKGWTGETCSDDVNECSEYTGVELGCQNGATCINMPGTFRCQCTADWHGLHCNSRHDDCSGASDAENCGHGTCVNQARNQPGQPKFKCLCDSGWTRAPGTVTCTQDVDECQSASSCFQHPSVHCINFPGGFTCSACPPGYTGNGFSCNDIDECEINNGGCSVNPHVICTNTVGSRTCGQCPAGYSGDGIHCQYVGVCQTNNGGCSSLATCTANPYVLGGRICSCVAGYIGTGIGSGGCRRLAPAEDPCQNNPCQNGGTCQVSPVGNSSCLCLSNFTGSLCEARVNWCASNPCKNGGTCVLTTDSYLCQCTSSFSGATCESQREECGGRFTTSSGLISYPSEPGLLYPHGIDCEWIIIVSSSKIVQLNFTDLETECHYDWLEVVDSSQRYGARIGRYCRLSEVPNGGLINSTGRGIRLWLHSDSSVAHKGFNVSWNSLEPSCGYAIQGREHGILHSPKYPEDYPTYRDCEWTISVAPGKKISILFDTFLLENHHTCNYDYLEIRNGLLADSPLLGKYCNRVLPPSITSSGPYLFLKFHSDGSRTDKGFNLIYTATQGQQGCGGVFTSHTGTLSSPNFPNPYAPNENCVWIIQPGHTLILTFYNIDLPGEPPCTNNYVEIRDGSTPTSPLIGQYCGQVTPPKIISNKNSLWINFKSGAENSNFVGFSFQWSIACGGVFTTASGVLESPFYGIGGDNSSEELCIFVIRQPSNQKISLLFNEMEQSNENALKNCTSNYIEIRHGDTKSSPLLGKYCGLENLPGAAVAQSLMRIEYKGSPGSRGFQANYTTTSLDCGGVLTGPVGTINSPHRDTSNARMDCLWHIIVDPDKQIRVQFTKFRLSSICNRESVELKNDGESNGQKFCGSEIPLVFTSTSNRMTFRYYHQTWLPSSFQAIYHAVNRSKVCGGILSSSSGIVMSPNFPKSYPRSISCTWLIQVQIGHRIQLNFTEFLLEGSHYCHYDYLVIRDGQSQNSPLVGKYCGRKEHLLLVSNGNQMWIRFSTDRSVQRKGFKLTYTTLVSGCGGDMTASSGMIISPKRHFAFDTQCSWFIHVAAGNRIALQFPEFHFRGSCSMNYLEIREPDRFGKRLARLCGMTTPLPLTSSLNSVFISQKIWWYFYRYSFRINYHSVCQNIELNDISGEIESPGFPGKYPNGQNCSWILSGMYGSTISLQFSVFELEEDDNYDYLEVRDGDKRTSPLIDRFYGRTIPPILSSTGSKLRIDFISSAYSNYQGFRIEYKQNICFRKLDLKFGTIRFPEDKSNSDDLLCLWVIKVDPGMRIELSISTLELDGANSCDEEFLKISDGENMKAPVLTTLCHTAHQIAKTTSNGNHLTVLYKTKKTTSERKFKATFKAVSGGCGGIYTMVEGSIQSPNYPYNYPHNSDCNWLIEPKVGHFIFLKIEDFNLGQISNCSDHYFKISSNNEVSEVFCGGDQPIGQNFTFESSVLLSFKSNKKDSAKGFKLNFTQECGHTFPASPGGIISSDVMQGVQSCRWLLLANQSDERITVRFSKFLSHENCQEENLTLYNGYDELAPVIDTFCGQTIPRRVTSSGSALFIVVRKKKDLVFHLTYSTSVSSCGGDIYGGRGSISPPNYPDNYPTSVECIWKFKISPGNKIHLSFSDFSLESSDFCNKDYVEARRVNISGFLIGRFCDEIPQNITTNGQLWLKFRSDEDNSGRGFLANYAQIFGGAQTGSSGEIVIAKWDLPTEPIVWTITAEDENLVIFVVLKQMRFFIFQGECLGYIEIRDGLDADSVLIGRYCMDERVSLTTTSNLMYLKYVPFRNYKQEFSLDWKSVDNETALALLEEGNVSTPKCFHSLKATDIAQNFTSPGFPNLYAPNLSCKWFIYSLKGYQIIINFLLVALEKRCYRDYIRFQDASGRYRKVCGNNTPSHSIRSKENSMALTFNTDNSINGQGFVASYKRQCGGEVTLDSPWFFTTGQYETDCEWLVTTTMFSTIDITVRWYQQHGNCSLDLLQVYDGISPSWPILFNFANQSCSVGSFQIKNFNSSRRHIYIKSKNNPQLLLLVRLEKRGNACGGRIALSQAINSGSIQSVNYPAKYPSYLNCEWIIHSPGLHRIQIDFQDFNVRWSRRCRWHKLEFRDGSSQSSPLITRLCGNNNVSTVYSQKNVMYIQFKAGYNHESKGFKLKYSIAKCGGSIVEESGVVKSKNYPQNYENNLNCTWNVQVSEGHVIFLNFLDFKLQQSVNCTKDFVEIKEFLEGGDEEILFHGCGRTIPDEIQSSGNKIQIIFRTDQHDLDQGFVLKFHQSSMECGEVLENDFGTFSSLGYPDNDIWRHRCEWKIRVPSDRSVTLHFENQNINCHAGKLMVVYGWSRNSTKLGRFCSKLPETLQLYGNEAKIIFQKYNKKPAKFLASYDSDQEAVCGRILTSSSGQITNPELRNQHQSNILQVECTWTVQPQVRSNMTIVFEVLNMKDFNYRCYQTKIQIFEGVDDSGNKIGEFCSSYKSKWVATPFPSIFISYTSVIIRGRPHNFTLAYKTSECGGILTDDSGMITSPNYPRPYPNETYCYWKIKAPSNVKINVTIQELNLENSNNCEKDYLEILNGGDQEASTLAKLCGHKNPISYVTQTNEAVILFRSDNMTQGQGFRISYKIDSNICGGYHHSKEGSIKSPNYPHNYPAQKECIWKIVSSLGHTIHMNFVPPFEIEKSLNCQKDYVMLEGRLNGLSEIQQKKFCDYEIVKNQNFTSSKEVKISFKSNSRISGNGFLLHWTTDCIQYLSGKSGYIYSPGYPNPYPNNIDCWYKFVPQDRNYYVQLTVQDFDMEQHFACRTDNLKLYSDRHSFPVARYCGWHPPGTKLALQKNPKLEFITDKSISKRGFKIFYQMEECGGVYTNPSGMIEPIRSNGKYLSNMNCTFQIKVQEGRVISLKFTEFQIEAHRNCHFDYVAVYDGNTTSDRLIGKYCGFVAPEPIKSSSNQLLVQLVTDYTYMAKGFKAFYQNTFGDNVGCGGNLVNASGLVKSVDIDNNGFYEDNLYCHWRITVDSDKAIQLTFESFDVETSTNCQKDSLSILSNIEKEKFCGYQIPHPITSVSNEMELWFKTDSSTERSGFRATYTSILNYCGGILNASEAIQTISSPTRASAYQPYYGSPKCRWIITAPENYQIMINLTLLNIFPNCSGEYLLIRDQPMIPGHTYKYCGSSLPPLYYSHLSSVQINFITPALSESEKFILQYRIADCNRNYTSSNGEIFSPGWPWRYHNHLNCNMTIISPEGTKVTAYFDRFSLEHSNTCSYDYLQVKYSLNSSFVQTLKLCSNLVPPPIFSNDNKIDFFFKTDALARREGFHIIFTSTKQDSGCGGNFTSVNGTFTSPNYPSFYPWTLANNTITENKECQWNIQVPFGRQITLTIVEFALRHNSQETNCQTNNIKIYKGIKSRNNLFTTKCNDDSTDDPIHSTSNVMTVVMSSDGVARTPKFRIRYTS